MHTKNFKPLAFLLLLTLLFACKKEDNPTLENGNYLIFGHYYGECFGETCVETYKLTETQLFEDIINTYAGNGPFDFIELPAAEYEKTKTLMDYFPSELLQAEETTFGCPDCADQGGLFIQYADGSTIKSWRIDQSKGAVPTYLHAFMDKVNETITAIN